MRRFVKNEAIAPAIDAFLNLKTTDFQVYDKQLTEQERRALNFISRAISLQSEDHLALALSTHQPMVDVDRLLIRLTEIKSGTVFLQKLIAGGLDINQIVTIEGHRSLVRQPLAFPAGLYTVYDHTMFKQAVAAGLNLSYTTELQRSDRFLETDEINSLDIVLLLTNEQPLTGDSLLLFEHRTTVGLAERLQRGQFESLRPVIDYGRYDISFRYAKHFPLFYAIVGRQVEQFPRLLEDALKHPKHQEIVEDSLWAFHNYQPGLEASLGTDYYERLLVMGTRLKSEARVDFNDIDDQYVLTEYMEIVQRLRR